jgi:hypothetical protein
VTGHDRIRRYLEQIALLALEVSRNQRAVADVPGDHQAGAGDHRGTAAGRFEAAGRLVSQQRPFSAVTQ